ncbi:Meckelin (Transmembrane protein 67) [Diplonema papillatum]|nr:Meckelin (Transmembrane protein 67) [Diplonema papillatum]
MTPAVLICLALGSWEWYARESTYPSCGAAGEYFDASSLSCRRCDQGAAGLLREVDPTGLGCWCKAGYARSGNTCIDCVANGLAADRNRVSCLPCGPTTQGLAASARDCTCAGAGEVLADYVGDVLLDEKICIDCTEYGAVPNREDQVCTSGAVGCAAGEAVFEGVCVPADALGEVDNTPGGVVRYDDSVTATSTFLAVEAVIAAAKCRGGAAGAAGCQYLANLCALQVYDTSQGACALYWTLLTTWDGGAGCTPPTCDQPESLPWLLHQQTGTQVAQQVLNREFGFEDGLRLFVAAYTLNGTFLGTEPLGTQVFLCELTEAVAAFGFEFGNNIRSSCRVNDEYLSPGAAAEPLFFEVFIEDTAGTRPVPVRLKTAGDDRPSGDDYDVFFDDPTVRLTAGIDPKNQFYRRFMLYDTVLNPRLVRYASTITVLTAMQSAEDGAVFVPIVTVEYDYVVKTVSRVTDVSQPPSPPDAQQSFRISEAVGDAIPRTVLQHGSRSHVRVFYVESRSQRAVTALIITACCVAFVTSWLKAWAWQRRLVTPYLDLFGVLLRWFVYYCSHFSTYFFIIASGGSLWYFIWFKGQSSISVLVPPPGHVSHLYTVLLWTSWSTRMVDVSYRVYEQCTMWVFLLDWEQPRGRLVNEKKDIPVSMWRMVFAANEFNKLQGYLSMKIYATIFVTVVLLEAFGLQGLTSAQPNGNDLSQDGSYSHPLLRTALAIVLWHGTYLFLYLWEKLVYYRFFAANAVTGFVDLLSLANVSMFLLVERRYGYYVHGKSVHQFADASVREFQVMLKREEEGSIPMRGLAGQSDEQCFDMLIDDALYQFLWETQMVLARERVPAQNPAARPRRCYEYLLGRSNYNILTHEALRHLQELNRRLQELVTKAADEVQVKLPVHRSLGFVPMAFPGTPTRFFVDSDQSWTKCLLVSAEFPLANLALLIYLAIDWSFANAFVAASVAFVLVLAFQTIRKVFGVTNLSRKSMIDDRFFL